MISRFWAYLAAIVWVLVLAQNSFGQDSGTAKVYREQVIQLHTRAKTLLARAEELGRIAQTSANQRVTIDTMDEIHALNNLVGSLEQDAGRSYVDGLRKAAEIAKTGRTPPDPDKTFLVIDSECSEMGFFLGSLDNFLQTGDRAFLGFAKKGDELTSSIEAVL
jgi:hypothetical protein